MGKILAVDDEEEMLELVKMALERDGHQVDTEEDVKRVSAERCRIYDLLLLDVMMPGEDGFSLCGRIRAEVDCPILFLTAKTEDAALVQGFGLGADDYIKKPFSIAELRARVNAHLRREKDGNQCGRWHAAGYGLTCRQKRLWLRSRFFRLPKGSMRSVSIWRFMPGRCFPKNSCMRRSLVSMRRGIRGRLQSILKISAQN